MSTNEFEIDPAKVRRRTPRRPMPPGQTRHIYADKPDQEPVSDNDEESEKIAGHEDSGSGHATQVSKKGTTRTGTSRKKTPRTIDKDTEEQPALVRVFFDRRLSVFAGLTSIMVGCAVLIVLLSHLKTGALDQALIMNMTPEQIAAAGLEVKSGVGPLGGWFGNVLFTKAFGIGAFVLGVYFVIMGWYLTVGRKFNFWSLTFKSLLLTVAVSIITGLLTYSVGSTTFWGGIHGHYVNQWLLKMTGIPGAIFVSGVLLAALVSVYLNDLIRYVKIIRSSMAVRGAEKLLSSRRHKASLDTDDDNNPDRLLDDDDEEENENSLNEEDEDYTRVIDTPDADLQSDSPLILVDSTDEGESTEIRDRDNTDSTVFEIDSPSRREKDSENVRTEQTAGGDSQELAFEIDAPVIQTENNTGSVAEKLVAEQGEYDPRSELSRFKFPTLDLLENRPMRDTIDSEEQQANIDRILKTLGDYKITVASIKATVGPTVTLYEIVPTEGIRIAQIKRLEDDIAMSLAAKGIRIIAPMPGKGTVGIEVPNREPQIVSMRTILASKKFRESKAKLPVALGATISNEIFIADLASMPHALVAGATGMGKSVGLNVLITSLLYRKHPTELKFVMIDPKMVEFSVYERLRGHYLATLPGEEDAIVVDSSKVLNVLNSLCVEMDNRYALLRKAAVNKIEDYNRKFCQRRLNPEKGHKYLPYIVVIIDEFADLIMTGGKEIEMPVMRITQKARAVGIHMIIATQRPSTNVLTGLIKANCPTRIAFRVNQNVDSRTILDRPNAERLIGRGDMLFSQGGDMERMQCAFITSDEIEAICDSIDAQPGFDQPYILPEPVAQTDVPYGGGSIAGGGLDRDPLFDEAAGFVVQSSTASTSSLQRRYEIGYNRAGKIMDQMEAAGIVGPASGSKPRAVLVDPMNLERILANR